MCQSRGTLKLWCSLWFPLKLTPKRVPSKDNTNPCNSIWIGKNVTPLVWHQHGLLPESLNSLSDASFERKSLPTNLKLHHRNAIPEIALPCAKGQRGILHWAVFNRQHERKATSPEGATPPHTQTFTMWFWDTLNPIESDHNVVKLYSN